MQLDEKDICAMVRLVGEVAVIPGDDVSKKRFLLNGLAKLIEGNSWVWRVSHRSDSHKPDVHVSMIKEGFTDETFVKFLEACERPQTGKLVSRFFLEVKEGNERLTRSLNEIADAESVDHSGAVGAWKAANIGPALMSMRLLEDASSSTIGLYRHYGRPEFTSREVRIAHIVLNEVPWLHRPGRPDGHSGVHRLGKRQRQALGLLRQGHSRKQIAEQMNISLHTLHDYVKDIYDFLGVHSRAELMSHCY